MRLSLVTLMLSSVVLASAQTPADTKAIRALFDRQVVAERKGDVNAYMATVDPKSPAYAQTKTVMGVLFKTYHLTGTINSMKIVKFGGDAADVRVDLTTRGSGSRPFRNNRAVTVNHLVKRNGQWYAASGQIEKIEYLK